jgi:hypothetical protein
VIALGPGQAGLPDFSWSNIPKRKKYTKLPQNIPNGHKIHKMAAKYFKTHRYAYHSKALQNLPKFVLKYTNWQPWRRLFDSPKLELKLLFRSAKNVVGKQGCQISLGTIYPNDKKYIK